MSISPVDSSAVQQDPSPAVGKAAPMKDPIVSSGAHAASAVHSDHPVSDSEASHAVDALKASALGNLGLDISTDHDTKLSVITLTDNKTKEVVFQLPTKAGLAVAHSIDETLRGNLIDHKA